MKKVLLFAAFSVCLPCVEVKADNDGWKAPLFVVAAICTLFGLHYLFSSPGKKSNEKSGKIENFSHPKEIDVPSTPEKKEQVNQEPKPVVPAKEKVGKEPIKKDRQVPPVRKQEEKPAPKKEAKKTRWYSENPFDGVDIVS